MLSSVDDYTHLTKGVWTISDDLNTLVEEDDLLIQQYKKFSDVLEECLENKLQDDKEKSNWVIRIELNEIEMLDKNITMEDINFALKNAYPDVNKYL